MKSVRDKLFLLIESVLFKKQAVISDQSVEGLKSRCCVTDMSECVRAAPWPVCPSSVHFNQRDLLCLSIKLQEISQANLTHDTKKHEH